MSSVAFGALLAPGCSSDESSTTPENQGGTAGSAGTDGGLGGAAGTGGVAGKGGQAGHGGESGSSGTGGSPGQGGAAGDGGAAGTAGDGGAAGTAGDGGAAGTAGNGGAAGTAGNGGAGGSAGTAGAGGDSGSVDIQAVRSTADGTGYTLSVDNVYVTYTKPLLGSDLAGFFVQAEAAGPGLFVAVDPATLSPSPHIGDEISFIVTDLGTTAGLRQVTGLTGLVVVSSGHSIAPLVTDVSSSTDVVTALDAYESRAVRLVGSFPAAFFPAGTPQVSSQINTTGLQDGNFVLRMPEAIRAQYALEPSCTVTVDYGVMWRFNAKAQPSVYRASDLTQITCPSPAVLNAKALSGTQVVVTFSRPLDPATVDATDFAFDHGLTADAVSVNGSAVTVTTPLQTGGTTYTVTASNLKDVLGADVAMPNTAMFQGYVTIASLLINEVSPNIAGSRDLIELLVTAPGTTSGITVLQKGTATETLATLPAVNVAAGDLIVVHLVPSGATGAAPGSETTSKNEYAAAQYSANYDGAWDFHGTATGMTYSNRVLELDAPGSAVIDAVPFVLSSSANPPSAFPGLLQALQAAGLWLPADCAGALCTYTSIPSAVELSVDYLGAGTTATGNSIARKPGMNTKQKSDWNTAAAQSIGLVNP